MSNDTADNIESFEISREHMLEHLLLVSQAREAELTVRLAQQHAEMIKAKVDEHLKTLNNIYSEGGVYEIVSSQVDATSRMGQRRRK